MLLLEDGVNYTIFADSVYQQMMGRITISTNPMRTAGATTDGWTRTTRDDLGRVVTVETLNGRYPAGTSTGVVSTSYNAEQTTVSDQVGKVRRSITDGFGRLKQVIEDPNLLAYQTNYSYDALDDLTGVTQGGQTRTFAYDSLKRLRQAFNPESGTVTYTYDDNSNLQTKTDARGVITTYAYDGLNRVITRTYSGAAPGPTTPGVTYGYDAVGVANSKGRLTSVSSSVSSCSYGSYDVMGRLLTGTQTTDGQNYLMSYQYNLAGGMTSETYPSNKVVVTEYDSAGRIAGVKKDATTYYGGGAAGTANAMSYTAHGAAATMRLGNGKWEHTNFNSRLQPDQIGLGTSSTDSGILRLDYSYGTTTNNGNVQTQRIVIAGSLDVTQNYTYDELNRLKTANESSGANWSQTYDYDRFGNHWVSASTGYSLNPLTPQTQSAFNAANNRLVASVYDAAGNQTLDGQNRSFEYDAENRQTKFNVTAGQYFYDGDGHRVKKIDNSGTTVFVYNVGGQLIAEYHSDPVPSPAGGGGTSYLTSDHLGSTRVVTKSDGTVKARYDYLPFGEELGSGIGQRTTALGYSLADSTNQKFTQKERDNESGLDYFLARYYSSAQGRFTSVDPMLDSAAVNEPQTWNRYAYGLSNPLRYTDPLGLFVWDKSLGGRATDEQLLQGAGDDPDKLDVANYIISERNSFRAALRSLEEIAGRFGAKSEKGKRVQAARDAYGDEDRPNGVTVAQNDGIKSAGETQSKGTGAKTKSLISFQTSALGDAKALIGYVGHEGQHHVNNKRGGRSGLEDEVSAYELHSFVLEKQGFAFFDRSYTGLATINGVLLFNPHWLYERNEATLRRSAIMKLLRSDPLYQKLFKRRGK